MHNGLTECAQYSALRRFHKAGTQHARLTGWRSVSCLATECADCEGGAFQLRVCILSVLVALAVAGEICKAVYVPCHNNLPT